MHWIKSRINSKACWANGREPSWRCSRIYLPRWERSPPWFRPPIIPKWLLIPTGRRPRAPGPVKASGDLYFRLFICFSWGMALFVCDQNVYWEIVRMWFCCVFVVPPGGGGIYKGRGEPDRPTHCFLLKIWDNYHNLSVYVENSSGRGWSLSCKLLFYPFLSLPEPLIPSQRLLKRGHLPLRFLQIIIIPSSENWLKQQSNPSFSAVPIPPKMFTSTV